MSFPSPFQSLAPFTCQTWDRVNQVAAFCEFSPESVDGEEGIALGTIALAPARSAAFFGEQLSILVRIRPRRVEGHADYISKGMTQYGLFQPAPDTLTFLIETNEINMLSTPIPEGWYDQWHWVAALYNGSMMQIVVDGAVLAEQPATGFITYGPGSLLIGRHCLRQATDVGRIATLQLFDRALSIDQIAKATETLGPECRIDLRFAEATPFVAPPVTTHAQNNVAPPPLQDLLDQWLPTPSELESGSIQLPSDPAFSAGGIEVQWIIAADGNACQSGTTIPDAGAIRLHKSSDVPQPAPGTELWLNLKFTRRTEDTPELLGRRQLLIPNSPPPQLGPLAVSLPPLEISEKDNVGYFKGENFALKIDLPTATILSWEIDDEELLELGPLHQLFRAPRWTETCPDAHGDTLATTWSRAGLIDNMMGVTAMEALQDMPSRVVLQFKGLIIRRNSDVLFEVERDYAIHGDGEVVLTQRITPKVPLPPMGRIGMEMRLPKDLRTFTWFGGGPDTLSISSSPADLIDRYEVLLSEDLPASDWPVEQGHKRDVRWLTARNGAGSGLFVGSQTPFTATISPYSTFQLSEAIDGNTLTPDSATTVHLDHHLSYDATVDKPLPEVIETQFRMRGLLPADTQPWEFLKTGVARDGEITDAV